MTSHFIAAGNMGHMNPHFMMVEPGLCGGWRHGQGQRARGHGAVWDVQGCEGMSSRVNYGSNYMAVIMLN